MVPKASTIIGTYPRAVALGLHVHIVGISKQRRGTVSRLISADAYSVSRIFNVGEQVCSSMLPHCIGIALLRTPKVRLVRTLQFSNAESKTSIIRVVANYALQNISKLGPPCTDGLTAIRYACLTRRPYQAAVQRFYAAHLQAQRRKT